MRNKCPYLSTALECFAGSFGTVHCLTHEFHSRCEFRAVAEKGGAAGGSGNPEIRILNNEKNLLENIVAINF